MQINDHTGQGRLENQPKRLNQNPQIHNYFDIISPMGFPRDGYSIDFIWPMRAPVCTRVLI